MTPALAMVLALFVYPLGYSLLSAIATKDGAPASIISPRASTLYGTDIVFTVVIIMPNRKKSGSNPAVSDGEAGEVSLGRHDIIVEVPQAELAELDAWRHRSAATGKTGERATVPSGIVRVDVSGADCPRRRRRQWVGWSPRLHRIRNGGARILGIDRRQGAAAGVSLSWPQAADSTRVPVCTGTLP